MHDFLITIMLGLAVFSVGNLLEDFVPGLSRFHAIVTLALGVAAAQWLDYSLFTGLGAELRNADMGVWVTGLAIGGTTSVWRGILHWMGTSEGEEPEARVAHRPRRIAA